MADGHMDLSCTGLTVRMQAHAPAAALRYLSSEGAFAAAARAAGAPLPPSQGALDLAGELLLAWRSPSETLCLARSAQRLEQLQRAFTGVADGCFVELTGALSVAHVRGERIADLLARLGGSSSLPPLGGARRSRMADVPVLALCVRPEEVLLVIERSYAEHLWGWMRETLLDFP